MAAAEYSVLSVECNVLHFSQNTKQWVYAGDTPSSGNGASQVELFKKGEDKEVRYRIVGRLKADSMVVINSVLYVGMEYRRATDTFHQWQDSRFVYGLNFDSAEAATDFSSAVDHALITIGKLDAQKKLEEKDRVEREAAEVARVAAEAAAAAAAANAAAAEAQAAQAAQAQTPKPQSPPQQQQQQQVEVESSLPPLVKEFMPGRERRRSSIAYVPVDHSGAEKDVLPPPPAVVKGKISKKPLDAFIAEESSSGTYYYSFISPFFMFIRPVLPTPPLAPPPPPPPPPPSSSSSSSPPLLAPLVSSTTLDERLVDKKKSASLLSLTDITSHRTKKKGSPSPTTGLSEELQELKKEIIAEMRAELEEFKADLLKGAKHHLLLLTLSPCPNPPALVSPA